MKSFVISFAVLSATLVAAILTQAPAQAQPPAAPQASERVIEIKNYMFMQVTVPQGTKVTWINRDEVPHTVIEKTKLFHSPALDTDDKFSYVFDKPGSYDYFCSLHPYMVAKVIVTAKR
jgi:plastocyanin